ncbi:MAG: TolC family protein [Aquificota bacterium]|nr:TolC family protein [Aquificota bacterium]
MLTLLFLLILGTASGEVLRLEEFLKATLEGNRQLKALREDLLTVRKEAEATSRDLFPSLVLEERFLRTDVPAQVLFVKLNQERVSPSDLNPVALNDPDPVSSFETNLRLEIPIWLGGRLRSAKRIAFQKVRIQEIAYRKAEEEILLRAYTAFVEASFLKEVVGVAEKNLEEAREHLRIAEVRHKTGTALLSDVLRAKVAVAKAEERLDEARKNYETLKETLSLIAGRDYSSYDPEPLGSCPPLPEDLPSKAVVNSRDLMIEEERLKMVQARRSMRMSSVLPSVTAFASYSLYDRDTPFGADGGGYSFGISLTLRVNLGLATLERVRSEDHRRKAIMRRIDHLRESVRLESRKAVRDYMLSLKLMSSARRRLEEAEETVRLIRLRYRNGLARMVDLIDAQTQLENARIEYLEALKRCHVSYARALFIAGMIREVVR